jgi:sugar/nucleoside kinase (ribokinase family)
MGPRIAAVGEIGEDLYLPEGERFLGGISANFARAAQRAGAEATVVASIGDDERGARVRTAAQRAGLKEVRLRVVPGRTPEQKIEIQPGGERRFCGYDPGVMLGYRLEEEEIALVRQADVIALSCSQELRELYAQCLAIDWGGGARLVADFSQDSPDGEPGRPETWVGPSLGKVAVAFVGGVVEFSERLEALSRGTPTTIVLTAGAAGAFAFEGGRAVHQPTVAQVVVDTTGCGDAFAGAFCAVRFGGGSLEEAMRAGAEMAARVAARKGAG